MGRRPAKDVNMRYALGLLVLLLIQGCGLVGPYRCYRANLLEPDPASTVVPGILQVGVAKKEITPDFSVYETWNDVDKNGKYEPKKGDTFEDKDGDRHFDAAWLAGFDSNRPAKDVHDSIWVRALAFRNNGVTVVLVSTDTIGVWIEDNIKIRKSLDKGLKIDHVLFSSEHIHEVPDTMGIWSYPYLVFSQDRRYLRSFRKACKEAVEEAVRSLEPADMICGQEMLDPSGFMDDSRKPEVIDKRLSCMRFVRHKTDETLATAVFWGNHPETVDESLSVTADFIHFVREGMERGVSDPNGMKGFGGTCVYYQGLIGGLMTQLHTTVPDRNGKDFHKEGSFQKAQALGENVALECGKILGSDQTWVNRDPKVSVASRTIFVPAAGRFELVALFGLLHPGWYWGRLRTEVNVIRIGDVEILSAPGELYPEVAVGGVEAKPGQDFNTEPVEVPPLYDQMKGKMNVMIGLANDEIGYMVPKSQWDVKKPYVYDREQYGEENSGGPKVVPKYHKEASKLLRALHDQEGL